MHKSMGVKTDCPSVINVVMVRTRTSKIADNSDAAEAAPPSPLTAFRNSATACSPILPACLDRPAFRPSRRSYFEPTMSSMGGSSASPEVGPD
jgi:hypothetical protein